MLSFSAMAQSKGSQTGAAYLRQSFAHYDSIQKTIHDYAELGYLEYKSSAVLMDELQRNGFTIEKGVAGIPTAFVATYGSGAPVLGLMAEYDALPDLSQDTLPYRKVAAGIANGHGCGHNLLGTGSTAAAVAISKWLAAGHSGTIKLFGCPAEEGGGKAYMVRDGVFDGVDALLDWHPSSDNSVSVKPGLANIHILFSFTGKSAHASGNPDKGRSALDAVEAFDYMMNLMREHVPMTTRIHYTIQDGGGAPNVVPEHASVEYFIRSPKREILTEIFDRCKKAAEGAAMGTGTKMSYEILSGNYERLGNRTLQTLIQKNLEHVGGVVYDARETAFATEMLRYCGVADSAIGSDIAIAAKVSPLEPEEESLTGGSSDVGNVSWVVPVGSFGTATFVPGCSFGHSWQQVAAGGTTIGTKGLMNAAMTFYLSAVELYKDKKLLGKVKEEFMQRRGKDFKFVPLMGDRKPPLDYRAASKK